MNSRKKRDMRNIVLILLLLPLTGFGQALKQTFEQANAAYKAKNYALAATMYDDIIKKGIVDANVFYNAGNAYFKNHELGKAILNYERAKRLSNDDDIDVNLRIANIKTVDKIETLPQLAIITWWQKSSTFLPMTTLSWLLIASCWLLALSIAGYLLLSSEFKSLFIISAITSVIIGLLLFALASTNRTVANEKYAIIIPSNISVKSAPDESGTDLFVLHEGVKVKLLKENEDWLNIRIADGKVGWCKKNDAEII